MEKKLLPYLDNEVQDAIQSIKDDPMMLALLDYGFPNEEKQKYEDVLADCHSIYDFQSKIIYPALKRVLRETTEEFTTEGFSKLEKEQTYLYISNHRDIVLDTSLTNLLLLEKGMKMTSSAIGDNLVPSDFLLSFSKLNRNFLVQRSLAPREMLMSSIKLSRYIHDLVSTGNQSVWLAQREGRTKDGNDVTQQGILKMLSMSTPKGGDVLNHLNSIRIVPLAISYEYDPTDYLKMPALLASYRNEEYVKTKNEDFNNIMTGVLGQKKRVHINAGEPIQFDRFIDSNLPTNQQLQLAAKYITERIHEQYHIWPTNYMAYDILYNSTEYRSYYETEELIKFEERVARKVDVKDEVVKKSFLAMYANPVLNKKKLVSSIVV